MWGWRWFRLVVPPVVLWLVAGVAMGGAWCLLTPVARSWSSGYERDFAGDVTLAGLEVLAGALVALVGLLRSGPGSTARFGVAVIGSSVAAPLAWGTGRLAGAPVLSMIGVLLLWPLSVALVTVLGAIIATLVVGEPSGD